MLQSESPALEWLPPTPVRLSAFAARRNLLDALAFIAFLHGCAPVGASLAGRLRDVARRLFAPTAAKPGSHDVVQAAEKAAVEKAAAEKAAAEQA